MISRIKGKVVKKEESRVILEVGGICYEIAIPRSVSARLSQCGDSFAELIIYHYMNMEKNRGIPVMIGFIDELEKEFFSKFIGVSGIGPKAALKAFDKPIAAIAQAIEGGDVDFLKTLAGIGKQKAKQIVAHLQGKVGRFALIRGQELKQEPLQGEVIEEAKKILKRLQYNVKEIEEMVKKALIVQPRVETVEDLLNEIYRQRT